MKLFEEFKEDLYFYISKMLKDISNDLKKWFNEGMLSSEDNVQALYFETTDKGLNPFTMVTFEVDQYRYDAYFLVVTEEVLDLEEMSNPDELSITVKIKVYGKESEHLTTSQEDITYKDLNEDYLLSRLSDLKDEIEGIEGEDENEEI
jgi:hypothetical protein